jgi:hypothetical protein
VRVSVHALRIQVLRTPTTPQTNCQSFSARTLHSGGYRTSTQPLTDQLPEPVHALPAFSAHRDLYHPNRPTARVSVHALLHSGGSGLLPPLYSTARVSVHALPFRCLQDSYHPIRPTARVSFSARTPAFRWLSTSPPHRIQLLSQCTHSPHSGVYRTLTLIDQLPEFLCTHSLGVYRTLPPWPDQLPEFQCTHSHSGVYRTSYHPTDHCQSFSAMHSRI